MPNSPIFADQDTDLNRYEKRSIITFMSLYMGGILLLLGVIGFWYYTKENRRIAYEERIAFKLYDAQCERLARFAPKSFACKIEKPNLHVQYEMLQQEIFSVAVVTIFLAVLLSYLLARLSLRPMHEAYELMDSFIHAMIHDLNTPITAAKLSSDALLKSELNEAQQKKIVRIQKSLERMLSLQEQLRSSIKSSAYNFQNNHFRLDTMLQEFKEYSELIELHVDEPLTLDADEMMISRMIENLVTNAIKYNQDSNIIVMTLSGTTLTITDKGQGIKDVKRVFERYYREQSSMSGLGLGLEIVKRVSDYYDVKLSMTSKIHVGTTVTLNFDNIRLHTE